MDLLRVLGYEPLDRVGAGLSAEVFRVRKISSGEIVALKLSHRSPRHSAAGVTFKLEYYLHSHLDHPDIVRALNFGEVDEERRFYTMEYVPALSLGAIYGEGGMPALGEVALRVAEALEYAHAQGILHGDVKPGNILASMNGAGEPAVVRLADFGLSQRLASPSSSSVRGTIAYLAPEALMGWRIDGRADLYSLGVALFEAVTAQLPYGAGGARDLVRDFQAGPVSLRALVPDLEAGWASLVDDLISRSPSNRPASASITAGRMRTLLGKSHRARRDKPPRAPLSSSLGIIGREPELRRLFAILGSHRAERGERLVLVIGDAGVGKSRLVDEFAQRAALDGAIIHRSSARDGEAASFDMMRQAWREGRLIGLQGNGGPAPSTRRWLGRGSRESLLEALAAELIATAGAGRDGREIVLIFDGLECADLDSLEFLAILRRHAAERGAMLVLVARAGPGAIALLDAFRTRNGQEPGPEEMRVQPLSASETSQLALALLGESPDTGGIRLQSLDEDDLTSLTDLLQQRTGGNPRAVESALQELVRLGLLRPTDEGWSLEPGVASLDAPSLLARDEATEKLRELGEDLAPLLELASVLGREFPVVLLSSIDDSGGEEMASFLAKSFRLGLLAPGQDGFNRIRFVNPEVARAVYERIPAARRRDLHGRVAEALTAAGEALVSTSALAEHFDAAGDRERACEQFLRAAREDYQRGAYREAARNFRKVWERQDAPDATEPDFALDWIHALFLDGRYEEGSRVADEIRRAVQRAGASYLCRLAILEGICFAFRGEHELARVALGPIVSGAEAPGDASLEAWAQAEYGWLEVLAHRDQAAAGHFARARDLAIVAGDPRVKGLAELRLGILEYRAHRPREALEWHERARDTYLHADIDDALPSVWSNMGLCHWNLLETRDALSHHRRAIEGYARLHRRGDVARGYSNLANALAEAGRWSEAEEAIASADRWNRGTYAPLEESYLEYVRAQVLLYRGDLGEATRRITRALELSRQVRISIAEYSHLALLARILLRKGELLAAHDAAAESFRMAAEHEDNWARAEALYVLAMIDRAGGDLDGACRKIEEAVELASEPSMPTVLFRILAFQAELLAERGEHERAGELLEGCCRQMLVDTGLKLWEGELALATGRCHLHAGEADAATQSLSNAYDTFAELGAEQLRAETLAALAQSRSAQGHRNAARSAWRGAENIREHLHLPARPGTGTPDDQPSGAPRTDGRVLAAAAGVSRELVTLQSLEQVLSKILDLAVTYLGTERGVIALTDPVSGELRVELVRNMDRESVADALEISRSALHRVGECGELVFTGDALADPDLGIHESIQRLRIRSLLATPLRWHGELLGVLYVDHRELTDLFGPEELLFLQFIADMAAVGIRNARRLQLAEKKARELRGELEGTAYVFAETAARSAVMQEIMERASLAARAGRIVLLTGENGVGKDHLARLIHRMSGRHGKFVDCPLPSLMPTLIEAELFGVAKRVATDVSPRRGMVEEAHEGTLFLNEIGDLPPELQGKLLRLLDDGEYRRVGAETDARFRGLIVCATNADLERMVDEGSFRADLFYRISGDVIRIPRLADHPEDIPDLIEIFLRRFARNPDDEPLILTPRARELLWRCPWEGNVRELALCIRRAAEWAENGVIDTPHLESPSLRRMAGHRDGLSGGLVGSELDPARVRQLRDALDRSGGIVRKVAQEFGVSNPTAWRWIEKAGLDHLAVRKHRRNGD